MSFELGVVVDDNGVREAIPAYEVFTSELLHLVGCDFSQWSCLHPLGEVVDSD